MNGLDKIVVQTYEELTDVEAPVWIGLIGRLRRRVELLCPFFRGLWGGHTATPARVHPSHLLDEYGGDMLH